MIPIEAIFFWITITLYLLTFAIFLFLLVFKKENFFSAKLFTALAFSSQTITIALRWSVAGHPPVFGSFENALAGSWFVALFTIVSWRLKNLKFIGLITIPMVLGILAYGLNFSQEHIPLTISERSLWVDIHATFAWLAYGSYSIAFVLGIFLLSKERKRSRNSFWRERLPSVEVIDDLLFKYVIYGFITQTITIASGSYYEFLVFGRWWRWDPIESITFVSWLLYALLIHLKRSFGWRGRQAAWFAIFALVAVIFSYWLLVFFPPGNTFHIFDLQRRIHLL